MIIKVTEEHIKRGKRYKGLQCPVALAIKEQLGYKALVCGVSVDFLLPNRMGQLSVTVPRSVQRFIKKFDAEGRSAAKPFNFTLSEKHARHY